MAANATEPQLLDTYGARQRMPQQRVPIPVNRPVLPVTAIPRATTNEEAGGLSPALASAPPHAATAPPPPALQPRPREPGIADLTADAGGRGASSEQQSANVPTMTGTVPMKWAPTKKWIKHGSPSLIMDMASTMRKIGQTLCKQTTPRRLFHNPSTPTVRKVAGKPDVERAYVDPYCPHPRAHWRRKRLPDAGSH
jgi:hypothetical protein